MNKINYFTAVLIYILLGISGVSALAQPQFTPPEAGKSLPLDLTFTTSLGQSQTLEDLFSKTPGVDLVQFVYFNCGAICSPFLNETIHSIRVLDPELKLGRDYHLWTLSISPRETPELASQKKASLLQSLHLPGDQVASGWQLLTGDSASITQLTTELGFQYTAIDTLDYNHKAALYILDTEHQIHSSLKGPMLYPFEVKRAIMQSRGDLVSQVKIFYLEFVLTKDTQKGQYIYNTQRAFLFWSLIALAFILPFISLLRLRSKLK